MADKSVSMMLRCAVTPLPLALLFYGAGVGRAPFWRALGLMGSSWIFGACAPSALEIPVDPDLVRANRALILVLSVPNTQVISVHALDLPADGDEILPSLQDFEDHDPLTISALYYQRSLLDLALPEGPVLEARPTALGLRPLPEAGQIQRLEAADPDWKDVAALDTIVADFRFEGDYSRDCVNLGGCLDSEEIMSCVRPCPPREEPAPPLPPEAPRIAPCVRGWVAGTSEAGVAICEPWNQATGLGRCSGASARFPGESGCQKIGSACPLDGWPSVDPGKAVLYVRPGAAGSGTRQDPLGDLNAALQQATPGSAIALAVGEHVAGVEVPADVALIGACAESTVLGPGPGGSAVLQISQPKVRLADLAIDARGAPGILAVNAQELELQEIWIRGASAGLAFRGSSAVGLDLRIEGVFETGIEARQGSELSLSGLSIESAPEFAETSTLVSIQDSSLILERGDLDLRLSATGRALALSRGRAQLRDVVIEGPAETAMQIADSALSMELVSIRGLVNRTSPELGAISLSGSSSISATQLMISNVEGSVLSKPKNECGDLTRITLSDLVISGREVADRGPGLLLFGVRLCGGELVVSRARIDGAPDAGMELTRLRGILNDIEVHDSKSRPLESGYGQALRLLESVLFLNRLHLEGNQSQGIITLGGTYQAQDLWIAGSESADIYQSDGDGLYLGVSPRTEPFTGLHSELVGSRFFFGGNRRAGLNVRDGCTLAITDLRAENTKHSLCADPPASCGGRSGAGVYLRSLAQARIERFWVAHNELAGFQLQSDTILTLVEGTIEDQEIGVNADFADLTPKAVGTRVEYLRNLRNFDPTVHEVVVR